MSEEKLPDVLELLILAGKAILEIYESDSFGAELKWDNSPVTRADKISSEIINKGLEELFPKFLLLTRKNQFLIIKNVNIGKGFFYWIRSMGPMNL